MYLGIDLGTSSVKVALVDENQGIVDQADAPLTVQRPRPQWAEQYPASWWTATNVAMEGLRQRQGKVLSAVRGIGLSGQMHGATLLDAQDRVLRPCILWNDGRSGAQCAELERRVPNSREITGNLAMSGFTAPKLLWVAEHEPEVFPRVAKVLLPKDYLRLRMTGDYASDMSDSSGTLWLDVAARTWSEEMLTATGLTTSHMPELAEGSHATGRLRAEIAASWGVPAVPVAGGGGDNAAGAVGIGVLNPGDAFLSLGTSGVLFVSNAEFSPNPAGAVHAFCHALPNTWHQMSVILSAASCLSWVARLTGASREGDLVAEAERARSDAGELIFLPYLSGERTPHNDPNARGVFFGLTHEHGRAELARAVLEGVAFAFADGLRVLEAAGTRIGTISVIGGGARSPFWGKILASVLNQPLTYHSGGEVGPAFGAARLGRLAASGESPDEVCTRPPVSEIIEPDAAMADCYQKRLEHYRRLYCELQSMFAP